ncbi:MAG: hypothetical protein KDA69_14565 [Planctomycetaceae bacterium]|nr:hypothetical protein [Planctomycetaceae bacterium]
MGTSEFYKFKQIGATAHGEATGELEAEFPGKRPRTACGVCSTDIGPVLKSVETLSHLPEPTVDRNTPGESYGSGWIQFQSGFDRTLQHAGNNTNQYSLTWVMP